MIDPDNPLLLHFTHINNLPGIVASGLIAPSRDPATAVECAHPGIKAPRRSLVVPTPPGGVVADYVPFYFAPRSPMLFLIKCGGVPTYRDSQDQLVYVCARLASIKAAGLAWVATDRGAAVATARYVSDAAALRDHIDWAVMRERRWTDTPEDGSRKQRRMAEFLTHDRVRWPAVVGLRVRSDKVRDVVKGIIRDADRQVPVAVVPDWYF